MNCRQAHNHLFAERDGVLDRDQVAALTAHVTGCADCRRIRTDLETAFATLRHTSTEVRVPDASLEWQRLRLRMQRADAPARKRSALAWLPLPLAAAAAIAFGFYLNSPAPTTEPKDNRPAIAMTNGSSNAADSTVVYVDDQSGWTFVWSADAVRSDTHSG